MKNLVKSLLALVAFGLAFTAPLARAADEAAPAPAKKAAQSPEDRLKDLTERLNLTADQQVKVKANIDEEIAAMKALPKEDRRTKGAELRKETISKIRALLTAEQAEKFPGEKGGKKGDKGGKGKKGKQE